MEVGRRLEQRIAFWMLRQTFVVDRGGLVVLLLGAMEERERGADAGRSFAILALGRPPAQIEPDRACLLGSLEVDQRAALQYQRARPARAELEPVAGLGLEDENPVDVLERRCGSACAHASLSPQGKGGHTLVARFEDAARRAIGLLPRLGLEERAREQQPRTFGVARLLGGLLERPDREARAARSQQRATEQEARLAPLRVLGEDRSERFDRPLEVARCLGAPCVSELLLDWASAAEQDESKQKAEACPLAEPLAVRPQGFMAPARRGGGAAHGQVTFIVTRIARKLPTLKGRGMR